VPAVRVLIGPRLDDGSRVGVARQLQVGEAQMMGSPVDPVDDDIGGALELIIESAFDQTAQHRIGRLVATQSETRHVQLTARVRHRPVHGLDDITSNGEVA
jgi:hypothetical protein